MKAELEQAVRRVYANPALTVIDYDAQPLTAGNLGAAGLYRVTGTARSDKAGAIPFALILKGLRPGPHAPDDPTAWNYWRREALAYQSGLLGPVLPRGLAAPRFGGAFSEEGGGVVLFLEEVPDEAPGAWPAERYAELAALLARFNVAGARQDLSAYPWLLNEGWLRTALWTGDIAMREAHKAGAWERLRPWFPADTVEVLRGLTTREGALLRQRLDALPRALCHFDAHRTNVLTRGHDLVLIDWAFPGLGAVGEEIGHLFAVSPLAGQGVMDLADGLYSGYLQGLREDGWQGDEREVRLGFLVGAVLRGLGVNLPQWAGWLAGPGREQEAERAGQAAQVLLGMLDEAQRLI
jgi:hypothetical protein